MRHYKHTIKSDQDSTQQSIYWIGLIIPFYYRRSFDRYNDPRGTIDEIVVDPVKEADPIMFGDDCTQWSVSNNKDSVQKTLQVTCIFSDTDYLEVAGADDWIFFWAFTDSTEYTKVKTRLLNKDFSNVNYKNSGLKFAGRIGTIFEDLAADYTGHKHRSFTITASAFSELESKIYFDPLVQLQFESPIFYVANSLGGSKEFQFTSEVSSIVKTGEIIPELLTMCLGKGPSSQAAAANPSSGLTQSPNSIFRIPNTVYQILSDLDKDFTQPEASEALEMWPSIFKNNQVPIFIDILKMFIGVHKYKGTNMPYYSKVVNNVYISSRNLDDPHLLQPFYCQNQSVWSILESYLNKPLNEMYTCMRLDEYNNIVPTVMCRRIPFTDTIKDISNKSVNGDPQIQLFEGPQQQFETTVKTSSDDVTYFLSLPRWYIDSKMVQSKRLGVTSGLRYNYMRILPNRPGIDQRILAAYSHTTTDAADIKRVGLKGLITGVTATIDVRMTNGVFGQKVEQYNNFMADILFDGHVKLSGTVTLVGIQDPICEGDNCVIDDMIYHIDSVSHSGSKSPNGAKYFNTTLTLSNGISIKSDLNDMFVFYYENPTKEIHMGINKG